MQSLQHNNYTLVVEKNNNIIFNSKEKGIKCLYNLVSKNPDILFDADVADTVIGKAAAMLYIRANIKSMDTLLISEDALELLNEVNIEVTYKKITPYIANRDKTGRCPMEKLAESSSNTDELLRKLDNFFINSIKL